MPQKSPIMMSVEPGQVQLYPHSPFGQDEDRLERMVLNFSQTAAKVKAPSQVTCIVAW